MSNKAFIIILLILIAMFALARHAKPGEFGVVELETDFGTTATVVSYFNHKQLFNDCIEKEGVINQIIKWYPDENGVYRITNPGTETCDCYVSAEDKCYRKKVNIIPTIIIPLLLTEN